MVAAARAAAGLHGGPQRARDVTRGALPATGRAQRRRRTALPAQRRARNTRSHRLRTGTLIMANLILTKKKKTSNFA